MIHSEKNCVSIIQSEKLKIFEIHSEIMRLLIKHWINLIPKVKKESKCEANLQK